MDKILDFIRLINEMDSYISNYDFNVIRREGRGYQK